MDPTVKAQAVALLESGEMRVAEVAELLGASRQLVATWCPNALEARRQWCAKRWSQALKNVDKTVADRVKREARNRKKQDAMYKPHLEYFEAAWRKENPDKPISIYRKMSKKDVMAWRIAHNGRVMEAEKAAYLADNQDKTADDYEIVNSCAIKTADDPRLVAFLQWQESRRQS
jgi:transposase-like protein